MNSRERVLAAIQRRPVDRIPFTPNIDGYSIRSMPARYHEMARWEIYQDLGVDLLVRARRGHLTTPSESFMPPNMDGPAALRPSYARRPPSERPQEHGIEVRTANRGPEIEVLVDTPVGSLRSGWRYTPQSPNIAFPTEHMLKTLDDVKTFTYILEKTRVDSLYGELEAVKAAIGDVGVVDGYGHCTPAQDLIMFTAGLENFLFLLQDHPREIEALLELMQDIRLREYRALAESPADVVTTYENTSTTLLSPAYMARYEFPALQEYSDILHAAGKIHLVHMCGEIANAIDLIAAASFDGVVDIAPPPTGDCDFRAGHKKLLAAGKCLAGGIDCTAFVNCEPAEMEEYVLRRLSEVAPGTGFLMGSGDAVPFGTPLENLRAVVRALEQFGKYPVEKVMEV